MSQVGYFVGGTAAGVAGIVIAALLYDKFSTAQGSLPNSSRSTREEESSGGCATTSDLATSLADLKKNTGKITESLGRLEQEESPERIQEAFSSLKEKHTFKPGDIVQWKQGMKNKKTKGPFVVVEVLKAPIFDSGKYFSGSQHFREPLDIVLGSLDRDGDFLMYHYDSRRFQHYSASPIPETDEFATVEEENTTAKVEAFFDASKAEPCTVQENSNV